MRWIGTCISGWGLLSRKRSAEARQEAEGAVRRGDSLLALLVPDAVGPAARRLHTFSDVESAAEFVQFWFLPMHRHSVIAFWALQERPEEEAAGELQAVALIRDGTGAVRAFSFEEMESAQSFLRAEALAGTRLERMIAYWAAPALLSTNHWGRVRFTPAEPPPPAAAAADRRAPQEAEPALTAPAPQPVEPSEVPTEPLDPEAAEALAEAERMIRGERWEQGDGPDKPFTGFGSPPGRF